MRILSTLALLALTLVEARLTIPISKKNLNSTRLERIVTNVKSIPHRYKHGLRVNHPIHNNKANANANGPSNGSLTDFSDELYTAPVFLGSKGQAFTLDLDTGSSDTWFRGPSCTSSDGSCGVSGQNKVDITDSSLRSQGLSWSTTYGSGQVNGKVYNGPVTLGDSVSLGATAIIDFGSSTSETGFNSPGDGLLGLGFSSISNIGVAGGKNTNFFDALGLSGENNVFSFYLSDYADGDNGEVTIGGIDTSKYTGQLGYVPLNAETYWQFSGAGSQYNINGITGSLAGVTTNFIADTGTTLMILDSTPANAINKLIGATYDFTQGIYNIPCKATNGPDIVLTIGGKELTITGEQYVINVGNNQCISGITQGAFSSGVVILGDTFLRAVYTVFDKENNQLGFAQAVHPKA